MSDAKTQVLTVPQAVKSFSEFFENGSFISVINGSVTQRHVAPHVADNRQRVVHQLEVGKGAKTPYCNNVTCYQTE